MCNILVLANVCSFLSNSGSASAEMHHKYGTFDIMEGENAKMCEKCAEDKKNERLPVTFLARHDWWFRFSREVSIETVDDMP